MSVKVILFKHPLNNKPESSFTDAGQTVRSAMLNLVSQKELDYYYMYLNGRRVEDLETVMPEDGFLVGRFVPEGVRDTGEGEKKSSGSISAKNLLSGVVRFFGKVTVGAMNLVGMDLPHRDKPAWADDSRVQYNNTTVKRPGLSGGGNATNPNGLVPIILGTTRITPYYAATPFTSLSGTDGVNQYLHMLYVIGYRGLKVSSLKLGEDLLATNSADVVNGAITVDGAFASSDVSIEIRQDGTIPALYDSSGWTIKESAVNATLGSMRNSTTNADISGGELGGLTITINATAKTITRSAGNWGTAGVKIGDMIQLSGMSNSGNNQPMVVTDVGSTAIVCYNATTMVNEGPKASVSATVTPANIIETAKNVRKISWSIEFPRGLVKFNKNTAKNHTVDVRAYYRKKGDTDAQWIQAPAWTGESGTSLVKAKATTVRYTTTTADLGTSYTGAYETRVVFNQPNISNTDTLTYVEDCTWTYLRSQHSQAPISSKVSDKVVIVALKVRASYKLRDTIEAFNLVATRDYTRTGATGNEASIRALAGNPAAAFIHACMDAINPRPTPVAQLDLAAILAWGNSCTTLGLGCNGIVTNAIDMRSLLQQIAAAGRATFFIKDGLYSVAHDAEKTTTVAHIAPRNSWNFSYAKSFEELPHGYKVSFVNKDEGYEQDECIVLGDGYVYDTNETGSTVDAFGTAHTTSEEYLPGQNYVLATLFSSVTLPFVTDFDQAWKTGRYLWEVSKYRNVMYSVEQDVEQLVATLGDKVRFSHPVLSNALYTARIKKVYNNDDGDVTSVFLDAPVTVAATYGCRIRTPSVSLYRAITDAPGETKTLTFSSVISAASAPQEGDLVFVGPAGSETIEGLVSGIEINEDFSATLSIMPYAQEVFDADDDTPPDFYTKVIKTSKGVVQTAMDSDDFAKKNDPTSEATTNIITAVADEAKDYTDTEIPSKAPKNLGRFNAAHPATHNNLDWWVVYDTDDSPIERGVWYDDAGTETRISAVSGETGYTTDATLLAKLTSCLVDIAWCEKNSYGVAADYGIAMFFESLGAVTAFIEELFAQNITMASGGVIKSVNYAETGGYPTAGYELLSSGGLLKAKGAILRDVDIGGDNSVAYFGNGHIKLDDTGMTSASWDQRTSEQILGDLSIHFDDDSVVFTIAEDNIDPWNGYFAGGLGRIKDGSIDAYLRPSVTTTANTTSGSSTIVVASATGMNQGMFVKANGIPTTARVFSISGTSIVLTEAATATQTGVTTYFGYYGFGLIGTENIGAGGYSFYTSWLIGDFYPWYKHNSFPYNQWLGRPDYRWGNIYTDDVDAIGTITTVDIAASGSIDSYKIDDDSSPLATKSTTGNVTFTVYKPISCVLVGQGEDAATLSLRYNSSGYARVASVSSSAIAVTLNPGNYKLASSGSDGAVLYCVGVYGSTDGTDIWS